MLAIRMQCKGRTHYPVYRIVVQEAERHPLSGRIVADLGSFNPHNKITVLDREKAEFYLKNGAQPSTRVAWVFQKNGIKLPSWVKTAQKKQKTAKHPEKLRKNQAQTADGTAPKEPAEATGAENTASAGTENVASAETVKTESSAPAESADAKKAASTKSTAPGNAAPAKSAETETAPADTTEA